jgi:hypothetical protein
MRLLTICIIGVTLPACSSTDAVIAEHDVPQLELVQSLRIGSIDQADQALTRVGGILPFPDGSVWIVQPADAGFRIYSNDASRVTVKGGRGQGPGEFTFPGSLGFWGNGMDSVWISDPAMRRVSIFAHDGSFVRSFTAPPVDVSDVLTVDQPRMFSPDGRAFAIASYTSRAVSWGRFPIVSYDPASPDPPVEVGSVDRSNMVQVRWQGSSVATGSHPLSDAPLVEFANDGRVIVLRRDADMAPHIEIAALAANGDTLWSRRYQYSPQPMPRSETDSIYDARIASFREFTRLEGRLSDDEADAAYRQSVVMPETRPAVRSMLAGIDGRLWLEWGAAPHDSVTWWVLDSDGSPIGQFEVERSIAGRAAAGSSLWAVETDDLDVPYVVRYDVRGPD